MKKYIANKILDFDGALSDYITYSVHIEPIFHKLKVWCYNNED